MGSSVHLCVDSGLRITFGSEKGYHNNTPKSFCVFWGDKLGMKLHSFLCGHLLSVVFVKVKAAGNEN